MLWKYNTIVKIQSAVLRGVEALPVVVSTRVDSVPGAWAALGLSATATREAATRVRSALQSAGFAIDARRVTVCLAPIEAPHVAAVYDLPIALSLVVAQGLLNPRPLLDRVLVAGELALDGTVKPIRGALSLAETAQRLGLKGILLPQANAAEAALVAGLQVYGVESLRQAVSFFVDEEELQAVLPLPPEPRAESVVDFADIHGQLQARRAVEVAAAGGHNLLLLGPPGSGKTMIARRIGGILPLLTREEAIETMKAQSAAGLLRDSSLPHRSASPPLGTSASCHRCQLERPFRAPHHTCSTIGLLGGGSVPRPGEVSLAHHGVLFLDELPEFPRSTLEALRQPLEDGSVTIACSRWVVTFPAQFMLVAAMNPCPCGYRGSTRRNCTCGGDVAARYLTRIPRELLDRFAVCARVAPPATRELLSSAPAESSATIALRVAGARKRRAQREARGGSVELSPAAAALLQHYSLVAATRQQVSSVAQTIADLAGEDIISDEHMVEALSYRAPRGAEGV